MQLFTHLHDIINLYDWLSTVKLNISAKSRSTFLLFLTERPDMVQHWLNYRQSAWETCLVIHVCKFLPELLTTTLEHMYPNRCTHPHSPLSRIFLPVVDLRSRLRPELKIVLSSSRGLVRGLPLAGLKSKGEEEQEWALRGSGLEVFTGEKGGLELLGGVSARPCPILWRLWGNRW